MTMFPATNKPAIRRGKMRVRCGRAPRAHRLRSAFTLLEMLVTVVVLGIAGSLLIPAMGQTGVLRVQGAIRMVISDMTFIQSDAVAFQERRAIVFDTETNSYALVSVPGNTIDVVNNVLYDPSKSDGRYLVSLSDPRFGGTRMTSAEFDSNNYIIFDALGGPISDPGTNAPSNGGTIRIQGSGQSFRITVDAFTGRIRVIRDADTTPSDETGGGELVGTEGTAVTP